MEEAEGDERIDLGSLFLGLEHYLLKINGDSMEKDGILDGALVVIKPAKQVRNGDLVVALVDNTAHYPEASLSGAGWQDPSAASQ